MPLVELIPNGLCRCGCGEPVYVRKYVDTSRPGKPNYKYEPREFLRGHNQRVEGRWSRTSLPKHGENWMRRIDVVDPKPVLDLVKDRQRRYGVSTAAMERAIGIYWIHNLHQNRYLLKSSAERILRGLSEHYPYRGYVPDEGEIPVEPKTTAFNYITVKPTGIRFSPRDPDWDKRAACKGKPLSLFFPASTRPTNKPIPLGEVRSICAGCPVADDCFGTALSFGEEHGIWGEVWFGSKKERDLAHSTYAETKSMAKTRAKVVKFARLSYADRQK